MSAGGGSGGGQGDVTKQHNPTACSALLPTGAAQAGRGPGGVDGAAGEGGEKQEKAGHRRKKHPRANTLGGMGGHGGTAMGAPHIFIALERKRETSRDWSGHQD